MPYRHPAWISRARARMRHQRGVTLVEAAFVMPIFLLFLMAIFESGLYMRNYLGVSNAVRSASRAASAAGAQNGRWETPTKPNAQITSADLYIVNSVARESAAIPRSAIQFIVVYKATGFGAGPSDEEEAGVPGSCLTGVPRAGLCNVYTPADFDRATIEIAERQRHALAVQTNVNDILDPSKITFGCNTSSPDRFWCPDTRKDRLTDNNYNGPDYVGVYMRIRHEWLTGIFGEGRFIDDQSVVKIEPRQR
jgi:hypothetical protein